MRMLKDASEAERATVELSKTVQLAVQAFDGGQLSEDELEVLCAAALSEPTGSGRDGLMLSERVTARFLVTVTGTQNDVILGVATADEALEKIRELHAEGLATIVCDGSGREHSIEQLRAKQLRASVGMT